MTRWLPVVILTVVLTAALSIGGYWWQVGRYIEATDNAYIRGEITPVSVKVSGYVDKVLVSDNQVVAAGQPLVTIEDLEFRVRLERGRNGLLERQAALLVATGQREQQQSEIELAKAQLTVTEVELENELEEFSRFESLYADEVISPLEYGAALAAKDTCRAEVKGAAASLRIAEQEAHILRAEEQRIEAEISQQREELKLREQELADTSIRAPIAGTVGNRRIRAGEYVRPGSRLMALIPLRDLWIEANFKEVQLARMHEGQSVKIEIDAFPDETFSGQIQSFAPASGAEFSLLPPENASGNFTKIVQRVPVKISLDADQKRHKRLLPGMSVEVTIDTRQPAAPLIAGRQLAVSSND